MPSHTAHRMCRRLALAVTPAAVCVATLGLAAPAMAKPVAYSGTTSGGDAITFTRTGKALKDLRASVPTTCAPAGAGAPRAGSEIFQPPGRLPLGPEVRRSALQEPTMHYADVTKN